MSSQLLAEYRESTDNFIAAARAIPKAELHKFASEGEWSPASIIHHLADAESHFFLRYLRIITEDNPETGSFNEDAYPAKLKYEKRDPELSLQLLQSLRESFLDIMQNFSEADWQRTGRNSAGEYPIIALIKKSRSHINDHLEQLVKTRE